MGVFLFLGAALSMLAGVTLAWPGTVLDRAWELNPTAYLQMAPLGRALGIPFLALGAVLAIAGIGWFRRRLWAWWLTVVIIASQVLGGLGHVFMGQLMQGAIGTVIPGVLLFYLLRAARQGSL